tara:strand:+ start:135 stop:1271 length:1137 start_codon:yes stop_codon:yes gene_type:complete
MIDKKYFCYEIYKNLAVWSANGKLGYNPCSFFNGYIKTNDQFNLSDIWNSPEHLQLKHQVENDIPIAGCQGCYNEEAGGLTSRRMASKKLYEEFHNDVTIDINGPQGLDYSVGNLCNLKCIICGPSDSTAWLPDYQKLNPGKSIVNFQYQKFNQIEIDDTELLKNIISIHFHGGGDPLMSKNHIALLEKIKKIKSLSDIRIFYNTNGTHCVEQKVLDLWKECKLVELYFSIDDIGERFNYQRTGADWKDVVRNLEWYKTHMPHNHMFNINCVWGYLNLYYLTDLVDWHHKNFSFNRYGDITNLIFQRAIGQYDIKHLSNKTKQILQNRFINYPGLLNLVNTIAVNDKLHDNFWKNITELDQIRNTNFRELCPEWSTLL